MSMFEHALTKEQYYELQDQMDNYQVEPEPVVVAEQPKTPNVPDYDFMQKGACKNLPPEVMFGRDAPEVEAAKAIAGVAWL